MYIFCFLSNETLSINQIFTCLIFQNSSAKELVIKKKKCLLAACVLYDIGFQLKTGLQFLRPNNRRIPFRQVRRGFFCFPSFSGPLRYHIHIIPSYSSRTSIFHFNYVLMPFTSRATRFHSRDLFETACVIVSLTALDLPTRKNTSLRYSPSGKRAQSYNALGHIYVDTTFCCQKYNDVSYTLRFKTFLPIVVPKNRFKYRL